MRSTFEVGDRVRPLHHPGFAGKITDRCWMPDTVRGMVGMGPPDGFAVKVTHVPDDPREQRFIGWEFAVHPRDLEHID